MTLDYFYLFLIVKNLILFGNANSYPFKSVKFVFLFGVKADKIKISLLLSD